MSNIHGLGSIKASDDKRDGGSDAGADDQQNYYAGGGGAQGGSGVNVVGPPRGGDDAVERIFARAQNDSAEAMTGGQGPPEGARRITMYRNGFVLDDGPFRSLDDPANAPFLADLERGFVPRELVPEGGAGSRVDVSLVDKRGEDYTPPPKPAYTAFSGDGMSLGAAAGAADEEAVVRAGAPVEEVVVDESQPTTTIQIRTHDRKRIRATFNLTHTIRHVQAYLAQQQGDEAPAYVLMAGFPPKRITDFDQTLEAAGLKNAAITQQLA